MGARARIKQRVVDTYDSTVEYWGCAAQPLDAGSMDGSFDSEEDDDDGASGVPGRDTEGDKEGYLVHWGEYSELEVL